MSRTRFVPVLLAATCVVASAACSDSTSPTPPPPAYVTPAPSLVTLSGVIHLTGKDEGGVVLETPDGEEIPLAGAVVVLLARVEEAGVEVRGTWDAEAAFLVSDFLVRSVAGVPVMDGVLVEFSDEDSGEGTTGYGLRLTRSALIVPLNDPPVDLREHVGERVWVTGKFDGSPGAYGIIDTYK